MAISSKDDEHSTVHDVIQICLDGEYGFKEAASAVDDSNLRAELQQYSSQRREFAAALTAFLPADQQERKSGGTAVTGSITGMIHRGWLDLRQAISSNDRYAVLAECERGEDAAVTAYRDASTAALSPDVARLISTQRDAVKRVHDRIKLLRDAADQPVNSMTSS